MQAKALPGFRDFYPAEFALRDHLFSAWRTVASRYGFLEWDGPPLESLDLYTQKSGTEIVEQLYAFEDKGGRKVALRPEMTPSLARMVAARANGLKKPIRWYSIPQLFRYERQQRGRLREHFQLNCDLIGEAGPLADAEIIALAADIMRELGLGPDDVVIRLSDRRVLTALLRAAGVPEDLLGAAYQIVDKLERLAQDAAAEQFEAAGLQPMASRIREIASVRGMEALDRALAQAGETECAEDLRQIVRALEAQGLAPFVEIDLTIVRGLAYYTGPVFEIFDRARAFRAICGGGRYDGLLAALGGVDLPACGFGMGDVVLGELLRDRGLDPKDALRLDCFVAGVTPEDRPHVLALAHELRAAGYRTEFGLGSVSLAKQLKLADAREARCAVVIGPDDRERGEVVLKDLDGREQQVVLKELVVQRVGELLERARARNPMGSPLTQSLHEHLGSNDG